MTTQILLEIPPSAHVAVMSHLLPRRLVAEEAAFLYARGHSEDGAETFQFVEWSPVPPSGFLSRSRIHLELTDEMRATAIKRAHDLDASLVELHSHVARSPAEFSPSDLLGFREFVPHVWWRLKGKPYLAIVVSRASFDGLAWRVDPKTPERLDGIVVGSLILRPTRLSPLEYDFYDARAF